MPYTPPSHNSPAASRPESPSISRSHSYVKERQNPESPSSPAETRPGLPRSASSASYLHKHRRSPSFNKPQPQAAAASSPDENSPVTNGNSTVEMDERSKLDTHGAIATPPESAHNSSDDEENSRKGSGRQLENLEELQAAIRIIEQHRASSPTRASEEAKKARRTLELVVPQLKASLQAHAHDPNRPPLSRDARKISHSRSSTESSILVDLAHQVESPSRTSEDSDGDELQDGSFRKKPPMLRKKSGELVRPALRPASAKRRPSSMPGTPTYSKAVHFDSHLEHVRHFLQVDKPLAVSAGSSPVESYESEIEFPFGHEEAHRPKGPHFEWEIRLSNFPADTPERKFLPVCAERIFLSSDNKHLVGVVTVANIAFSKHVTVRFTLDYWKTTSEVVAEYNNDVRCTGMDEGRDQFSFSVKLADLAHLENKTMFICIRYNVDGREFWDNNNSMNYQVDFAKKAKPQHGKNGMPGLAARPLNALPRSRPSPPIPGRPKVVTSFDDFSTGTFDSFKSYQQSPTKLMGESPIRLKKKPSDEIIPDAPTRRSNAAGQAFSNRYDFGVSLSTAIQAASTALGDRSGLQLKEDVPESKQTYREVASASKVPTTGPIAGRYTAPTPTTTPVQKVPGTTRKGTAAGTDARGRIPGTNHVPGTTRKATVAPNGAPLFADKPSLSSQSYQELVDKYCFFGSAKTSPQQTKPTLGQMDGANDDSSSVSDVNIGSVKTSGHASPSREASPPPPEKTPASRSLSSHLPRSTSPAPATGSGLGSRSTSPISFGYPYHQPMQNGFLSESATPTATYG